MAIGPRELKRLEKELSDISAASGSSQVRAHLVDGDPMHWEAEVMGPEGTPYEGGEFKIAVDIPSDYPYNPPEMKFSTKIWHPNISSQTGGITLDVLGGEWKPAFTIRTSLLSIQALLSSPDLDNPQDADVAEQYKTNRDLFNQTARQWTESFAMGTGDRARKLAEIADMGFTEAQADEALLMFGDDVTSALKHLVESM
mmetsp:Transcript_96616/g.170783  ORF Transcript_96616/g.170783 Transcript_96616/m.170783 type:complete len:199 (+) Transcript_96616:117-713(+)